MKNMEDDFVAAGASSATTSPVQDDAGGETHRVGQGDCIESIALDTGHFWDTLWTHPDNASLRNSRKLPNLLFPGDIVNIPDIRPKKESVDSEKKHRFRRKGVPSRLNIQLKKVGKPRAHEAYRLEIDGQLIHGETDAEGWIRQPIAPNARNGRLFLKDGGEVHELELGGLDPVASISGQRSRLENLGYACTETDGQAGSGVHDAIRNFQRNNDLEVTGECNQATHDMLVVRHGC